MKQWSRIRHQVAIAGRVTNAQTNKGIPMAQVRISQAPEGFVTSLITKAQLVTLANEPTKVVQARITLDDAAASNAQKLEAAQKIIDFLMARQALTTLQPLYRSPGLYKEYIFPQSSVKLDTGVPAFLGICNCQNVEGEEIPLNQPQQFRWSKFEQFFGKSFSHSYLAYAVRGFFQNGGQRCYVVYLKNTTLEALQEGLTALESLNTIDLVCAPDIMSLPPSATDPEQVSLMQSAVLEHCSKLGDRFAILDSLPKANLQAVQEQRQKLTATNGYGALYYSWVRIVHGPEQSGNFIPPCGHVAGVYARSDDRIGVHKAPGNEILEGVLGLEISLTNKQQGQLNPHNINCLRAFPGRGIRIWGARTLSSNPQWRYVNVRRLFLTVLRWLELEMAPTVFEPNNSRLWASIRRELTVYFNNLFERGALKGNSPSEAFYIKCDEETNPPEIRDAGKVVTEIGLAPAVLGEFIRVRITQNPSGIAIADSTRTG